MEEGARTRGLREKGVGLQDTGSQGQAMAHVLFIQLSQGHGVSKPGAQTSFSQELGDMEASLCLLGKLSSLLRPWRDGRRWSRAACSVTSRV